MLRRLFALAALIAVGGAVALVVASRGHRDVPLVRIPDRVRDDAERAKSAVVPDTSLPAPDCPQGVPGCRSVSGRIVYVERVDPDGDGDLHVVVRAASITLPGLTSIDVRRGLRPASDPRIGDRAAAAGPVQTGSYGQSQIHALVFNVSGR